MFINSNETVSFFADIFKNEVLSEKSKFILGNSSFCYGLKSDPTVVIMYGGECPLYIYVNNILSDEDRNLLFAKFDQNSFSLVEQTFLPGIRDRSYLQGETTSHNIALSTWFDPMRKLHFCVLTVQDDIVGTFRAIYRDFDNYICPKLICNYGADSFHDNYDFLERMESHVEYILGYSAYASHCKIGLHKIYMEREAIPLYQKNYRCI